MLNPSECREHQFVMQSSELVWAGKWDEQYGRPPVLMQVFYICKHCGTRKFYKLKINEQHEQTE